LLYGPNTPAAVQQYWGSPWAKAVPPVEINITHVPTTVALGNIDLIELHRFAMDIITTPPWPVAAESEAQPQGNLKLEIGGSVRDFAADYIAHPSC
jgi:hypothetical protein